MRAPGRGLTGTTLLAVGALVAAGAAALPASAAPPTVATQAELASAGLRAFPEPGSAAAGPSTQVSLRGVDGPVAGLRVVGSSSGEVAGRWVEHADGEGVSFQPTTAFAPGEQVSVATGEAGAGTYAFTVATPAEPTAADLEAARQAAGPQLGDPVAALRTAAAEPDGPFDAFVSRPDLSPPAISLVRDTAATTPGLNLVTPMVPTQDRQVGPMLYDRAGDLVWFEPSEQRVGNLVQVDYLGTPALAWFEGETHVLGGFEGEWVVADTSYEQIATIQMGNGYLADVHDLTITADDTALMIAYDLVEADLSEYGGREDATVIDMVLQEVDLVTDAVLFEWHSLDHVPFEETRIDLTAAVVDWVHTNSLTLDDDGHLLMSARNTSSVLKIDRDTGAVLWRLGGRASDFDLGTDPGPAFPHDARRNDDGTLSVFDNGVDRPPLESRGVAWRLDEQAGTADLVRQRRHAPPLHTAIVGSYRPLPGGNELLSFGTTGVSSEVRGDTAVWESDFADTGQYTYRTYRSEWVGTPTVPPDLAVRRTLGQVTAWASWNGATEVERWQLLVGPDAGSLRPVATVARDGFETVLRAGAAAADDVVAVQALGPDDEVLGGSDVLAAPYETVDGVYATRAATSAVQLRTVTGGEWSQPDSFGGLTTADPSTAALDDGRYLVAVRGRPDGLYVRYTGPQGLQPPGGWVNLGGTTRAAPSVAALAGGRSTVVVCGTDGRVYQTVLDTVARRGAWVPLGGDCRGGGASVTSTPTGRLVVSAVGADRQVRVRAGTVDGLRGWVGVGGIATSAAAGAWFSDTRVVLVVRGSDGLAYSRDVNAVNGAPLGTWIRLGGGLAPQPALAVVRTPADLRVLVLGTNGGSYELVRTGYALGRWTRI